MSKKTVLLFFVISFLWVDVFYAQCSMCRAVLESEEGQATAKGINIGILYLMALAYLLVGFVGWKVFRMLKK